EQTAEDAGRDAEPPRAAIERAGEQPQRDGEIAQADDLDGVLEPRIGGAAEREGERGDQRGGRMPAAVAEEQDDARTTHEQQRESEAVERERARRGNEERQQEKGRREEQRMGDVELPTAGKEHGGHE